LPAERLSTPPLNAFIHSNETSFAVGDDSFIVNCWAFAVAAHATQTAAAIIFVTQRIIYLLD
jgi:hypothetical protein